MVKFHFVYLIVTFRDSWPCIPIAFFRVPLGLYYCTHPAAACHLVLVCKSPRHMPPHRTSARLHATHPTRISTRPSKCIAPTRSPYSIPESHPHLQANRPQSQTTRGHIRVSIRTSCLAGLSCIRHYVHNKQRVPFFSYASRRNHGTVVQ